MKTDADIMAEALPHWRCECGFRLFSPELELATQICFCGKGEGRWHVENGHLLSLLEEAQHG